MGKSKREKIWDKKEGCCVYCGRHVSVIPEVLTLDHIVPESKGGNFALWNLLPACNPCNSARGNYWPPSDFAHPTYKEYVIKCEQIAYGRTVKNKPHLAKKIHNNESQNQVIPARHIGFRKKGRHIHWLEKREKRKGRVEEVLATLSPELKDALAALKAICKTL